MPPTMERQLCVRGKHQQLGLRRCSFLSNTIIDDLIDAGYFAFHVSAGSCICARQAWVQAFTHDTLNTLMKVNIAMLRLDHTSLHRVAAGVLGRWEDLKSYLCLCLLACRPLNMFMTFATIRATPHSITFLCLAPSIRSHLLQLHRVVAASGTKCILSRHAFANMTH